MNEEIKIRTTGDLLIKTIDIETKKKAILRARAEKTNLTQIVKDKIKDYAEGR